MDNTWACIAAKNEVGTIADLVDSLDGFGFRVIVIDDGSDDETGILANRAGADVGFNGTSKGIAQAVMRGWGYALAHGAERIVQIDAGGSHDPIHALPLVCSLWRQNVDILIGSRFLPDSLYYGRPWRAFMSRLAATACSLKTGRWITDWTSGLRAFTGDAIAYLLDFCDYEATMHGWQIEVLRNALEAGMSIAEAPITYRAGESSLDLSVAREAFRVWRRL